MKTAITIRIDEMLLELFDLELSVSPQHSDRNSLLQAILFDRYGLVINPSAPDWAEQLRAAIQKARGKLKGHK